MLLDVLVEISFRELVLLLRCFLDVVDDILICRLVTTRMLRVRAPLVIDAHLCAI